MVAASQPACGNAIWAAPTSSCLQTWVTSPQRASRWNYPLRKKTPLVFNAECMGLIFQGYLGIAADSTSKTLGPQDV